MREYLSVVRTLLPVLQRGKSLDASWDTEATPLARQIAFGVLRDYFRLQAIVGQLVKRPLADKHLDVQVLLLAGIYSIDSIKRPPYASVNDTVESAATLGKPWAKGVVNGVLRNYIRQRDTLVQAIANDEDARSGHPPWLRTAIESAWGDRASAIMSANNTQAPMTLRVNTRRTTMAEYQAMLSEANMAGHAGILAPTALYLESPAATLALPGFEDGLVSVQDEASQLAAPLMDLAPGQRVLDACAAPGGKTCHMLEIEPGIELVALDIEEGRLRQVRQNLKRIGLTCELATGDLAAWKTDLRFDRILLDAPCSATGIIRRHPDIKLLRRESDIAKLVSAQFKLLCAAWRLLEPNGVLVYSTCSILPAENEEVIDRFLKENSDAAPYPIEADWGISTGTGRQLLPDATANDGFYYARLRRVRQTQ